MSAFRPIAVWEPRLRRCDTLNNADPTTSPRASSFYRNDYRIDPRAEDLAETDTLRGGNWESEGRAGRLSLPTG